MSQIREKQSSTISCRVAYDQARKAGYAPALIDAKKTMHSYAWDAIKGHPNVEKSGSGASIILIDTTDQGRAQLLLKTKHNLSVAERGHFENAGVRFD